MGQMLAKALQPVILYALRKILLAPETKQLVMVQLRELAAKSDTKIDDRAVDIFSEVWEVAIPLIAGKVK